MRLTLGILMLMALSVIKVVSLAADGTWEQKANMPTVRSGFTTCVVNGKIFAIGGYVDRTRGLVPFNCRNVRPKNRYMGTKG